MRISSQQFASIDHAREQLRRLHIEQQCLVLKRGRRQRIRLRWVEKEILMLEAKQFGTPTPIADALRNPVVVVDRERPRWNKPTECWRCGSPGEVCENPYCRGER